MKNEIIALLKAHKRKRIKLIDLEKKLPSHCDYWEYSEVILSLIDEGFLSTVKASKYNGKIPELPNQFNIHKHILNKEFYRELAGFVLEYGNKISIDTYYDLDEEIWRADLPYLKMIVNFLDLNGIPKETHTTQEMSYILTGDEKWLFNGGVKLLKRIDLYDKLPITNENEPASFAINPNQIQGNHKHLIVENKSVYYRLLPLLKETAFSTLIYGGGWRIISSIVDFRKQYPFEGDHKFYYFGDIDYEGLKIYRVLSGVEAMDLAISFYKLLMTKEMSRGKETQINDEKATTFFCSVLGSRIEDVLSDGYYWPQEGLNTEELMMAWKVLDDE